MPLSRIIYQVNTSFNINSENKNLSEHFQIYCTFFYTTLFRSQFPFVIQLKSNVDFHLSYNFSPLSSPYNHIIIALCQFALAFYFSPVSISILQYIS